MKVSINKNVLETILVNTQPYLEKKDLSQITSHLCLVAKNETLEIKASDYEIGLSYNTNNIKILDEGIATANGSKLLSIIKGLNNEDIILETINDYLYIKQKNSKYKLPMFNCNDFPEFPEVENRPKFDINSTNFIRAIKKIAPAVDTNNPKFELNGALINIQEDHINLVATDTKRLSLVKIENKTGNNFSLIIPKKAIAEMQKLFFNEIEIFYDETMLIAKSNNFTFFTKLINGKFPDYVRIIPQEKKYRILLNREKIVEAIKKILTISVEMKLTFKPESIVFESLSDDNIEAKTEIEFQTGLDCELELATNSKFITDYLSQIETPSFTLGYNDSGLPFTLESDNFITIIMPITI